MIAKFGWMVFGIFVFLTKKLVNIDFVTKRFEVVKRKFGWMSVKVPNDFLSLNDLLGENILVYSRILWTKHKLIRDLFTKE